MLSVLIWIALVTVPYALLAVAGALFWLRDRSFAALAVALGFAVAFAGQLGGMFVSSQISAVALSKGDVSLVALKYYGWTRVTHYMWILGIWGAAGALVWLASRHRKKGAS